MLAGLACGIAHAQTVPTPGAIQDTVPGSRIPSLSNPAEVIFPRNAPAIQRAETRRFLVSGFTFTGNTVVSEALLRRMVERYLDMQLTLAELDRVADYITTYYRESGYTVARAFIPAQRVEDGLVTIQIIEGTVESVAFKGQSRYRKSMLEPYLQPLLEGTPRALVTDAVLERQMMLLNDLPGLRARATLAPGQQFGTTAVEVETQERFVGVSFGLSNSGKKEIGRTRLDAGFDMFNPLTLGDHFNIRAMRSEDNLFRYNRLGYSLPIGHDGIRVAFSHTATDYDLAGAFAPLGIAGQVRSADATVSYPFVRSRAKNVIGALQWRETTTRQTVLGLPFSEAKLPLLTASIYANRVGSDSSATSLSVAMSTNMVSKGTNGAGVQNRDFVKVDSELTYLTGAARNWDFFFRGRGVVANEVLPDTEKYSIGGPDSVRGYQSSSLRGDVGYQLTVELRRQWMVAGTPGYLSVFGDIGGVRNKGFLGFDRLSSVGIGITHYLSNKGQVKVDYSKPLLRVLGRETKPQLWASMTLAF